MMFSRPMNTRVTPARFAFSMKFGIRWHSVSTWIINPSGMPCMFAQLDQAVEDRLPLLVAREVVIGDEEFVDALRPVEPDKILDVVRQSGIATCVPVR